MRLRASWAMVVLMLTVSWPAAADDLNPPPWRYEEGSTLVGYMFFNPVPDPTPEVQYTPYGPPSAFVMAEAGMDYLVWWGERGGIWPLEFMTIVIPNRPDPYPAKEIWVQLTWAAREENAEPFVFETDSGEIGELIDSRTLEETGELPPAGSHWMHTTYRIHIEPNPAIENVKIEGEIMLDQVFVDTICAPEPASFSLLALGIIPLLCRRRRR